MKTPILILLLFSCLLIKAQTHINDDNFRQAINTCLSTNPVDGMCSDSEYGAMPDWYVGYVTDMSEAFRDKTDFNGDISKWKCWNATDMSNMFYGASSFNQNIGSWYLGLVTSTAGMFSGATSFDQNINYWQVSRVNNMRNMFGSANSFNGDLSNWNVSNVTNMNYMFSGASSFSGDISNWSVSSVKSMINMFSGAFVFNQDISSWNVHGVTSMSYMFYNASSFNRDISNWDVRNVTNMSYMFDYSRLSRPNYDALLKGWSTQAVQQGVTFGAVGIAYCEGQDARQYLIDTYGWRITDRGLDCTIDDTNFYQAINTCLSTNPEDGMCSDSEYGAMPDWDVISVTDMSAAFAEKSDFNGDISNWDVRRVKNMSGMFFGASAFNQDIGSWDVRSVILLWNICFIALDSLQLIMMRF
jgi:surface protein